MDVEQTREHMRLLVAYRPEFERRERSYRRQDVATFVLGLVTTVPPGLLAVTAVDAWAYALLGFALTNALLTGGNARAAWERRRVFDGFAEALTDMELELAYEDEDDDDER